MDVLDGERRPLVVLRVVVGVKGGGGGVSGRRALNRSLIRLIRGALVYKPASPQSARFNSAGPSRVVASAHVFVPRGSGRKQKCREGKREEREPRGSREAAPEPRSCGLPARAALHLLPRAFMWSHKQNSGLYGPTERLFRFLARQLPKSVDSNWIIQGATAAK